MARVISLGEARRLSLPGRTSREIVSGASGAERVTLRLVEIAPPKPGEKKRGPHLHRGCEECIHVLSGAGVMETEQGELAVKAGDTILVPPGERHVTQNTGAEPLILMCFFPAGDVGSITAEFPSWVDAKAAR
jgi:mannose-6-phosphate isomerase-like protein (cupin superfamily)